MGRKLRVVSLAVKTGHEVLPVSVRVVETFKKCLQNISETWIKIPILNSQKADLIGLARPLWVDPQWPQKARRGQERAIVRCSPKCNACMELVMQGKPAFCPRWSREKRAAYRELFR
jgi:2,4-dienoyl-CoA reductase-like NADH-dependent reductase (Old Yellow Enzyme family)